MGRHHHWALISMLVTGLTLGAAPAGLAPGGAQAAPPDLVTAIEQVAKQNIPAVVHIEVTERQEVANPLLPFEESPFFHYFFGNRPVPKKFEREVMGIGTGMLIDAQGHILTNNHVVGGATKIQVELADGRIFTEKSVKVIGADPKTDLAVIQIQEKGPFPFVTLGDSDRVDVGQWVVAIGHPRGLDQTVTQGIISAKHRRGISDPSGYQDFLQTDAAINPGNSGGPLLSLTGEVIGVNAAIMSESGGFEGLGFAIPSNMASYIMRALIANGKVVRGWLGLSIQDLNPELAQSFGLSTRKGALVADVIKGGPADQAGIERGDIVIAFEGKPVEDASSFRNAVSLTPVGQRVKATIVRGGQQQEVTLTVGSEEEEQKVLSADLRKRLGIAVRPITPRELERYGMDPKQAGVAIAAIDPNSPFARAGFEPGDLILQVNGKAASSPEDLAALLGALPAHQKATILVVDHRTGESGYVQLTLP